MPQSKVQFDVDGDSVVGIFRTPDGEGPWPAVVFLGPLTSVKEQVPGNYADALARRGFATLAIDNRHFGESGGQPRQYEHPGKKVQDIGAALSWLEARPEVDGAQLAAVGVCAGAGYMSGAVAADARIKAFGGVAGFYHDNDKQQQWMGDRYGPTLQAAVAARERFEASGEVTHIPAVGQGDDEVAMPMAEAFTYYGTPRGAVDNYTNAFATLSREHTLTWDAQRNASQITVPTLMVHSENALAPALARSFYAALAGPKAEAWVTSTGQIDFYDDPALIEPVADRLAEHLRRSLEVANPT